jgi:hypothetical protein
MPFLSNGFTSKVLLQIRIRSVQDFANYTHVTPAERRTSGGLVNLVMQFHHALVEVIDGCGVRVCPMILIGHGE